MNPWRTVWLFFLAVLAWCPPAWAQHPDSGMPRMVVLVRHAERAAEPAGDPSLTREGSARAEALADTLRSAGVTAIITTSLRRTKETAAPLAARLQPPLKPEAVSTEGETEAHVRAVAAAVRRHAGGVVLVVGHSNTVPGIIGALGGPRLPDICDTVFDDLFILVPEGKAMRLVHARYGAPSPREGCR